MNWKCFYWNTQSSYTIQQLPIPTQLNLRRACNDGRVECNSSRATQQTLPQHFSQLNISTIVESINSDESSPNYWKLKTENGIQDLTQLLFEIHEFVSESSDQWSGNNHELHLPTTPTIFISFQISDIKLIEFSGDSTNFYIRMGILEYSILTYIWKI